MFVGRDQAEPYVLALLAILGMIGVFSLFAAAAGILRVAGRRQRQPDPQARWSTARATASWSPIRAAG